MRDDPSGGVDEERLRSSGDAVGCEPLAAAVSDDRVRDVVRVDELLRVAGEILVVDAEHDEPPAVLLGSVLEQGRFGAARTAPRRPEVDEHRFAPE